MSATPPDEPCIGIDLGTTNSVVAAVVDGAPRVIANRQGQRLTPSVVAIAKNGKQLVGQVAKRQAITNPESTVFAAKRLIGRRWGSHEVEDARKVLPYELAPGPEGHDVRVQLGGRLWPIPETSALVLAELKSDAEAFFQRPISKAVITVPAWFNDGQRQATRDAGRIAGLEVLRIINEPTSAALAYGFGKSVEQKVVVFDLGGGTLDVSVLDIHKGVFDVVAVGGDTYLGGEDFDRRLMDSLVFSFAKANAGKDLRQDKMAMQRLKDAAERAKCELSSSATSNVHLPFLTAGDAPGSTLHLDAQVTREQLEELTRDLVDRCIQVAERTLKDAGVRAGDVGEVLLVGGQTRMPRVQRGVRELFGREPSRNVHPDEVVALGAAIQAQMLVHPEASAAETLLLDVTPQSLGIGVAGGWFQPIIPRNTTIPTMQRHVFTTSQDQQTSVRISVLQGERERSAENELLGEFALDGIRPAPRGEVKVEVAFEIGADGIVAVSARDLATGAEQSLTVTATSGLSQQELEDILEEHRDDLLERRQVRRETETRRQAVEALLAELDRLSPMAQRALERSRFGDDVLRKAQAVAARARATLEEGRGTEAIAAEQAQLERTVELFRSLAAGEGA
jgi:molecular chaperone DnaK